MYFDETPVNLQSNADYTVRNAWHATYALLKFCEAHNCAGELTANTLKQMLSELEKMNFKEAVEIGATIPTGRTNGCFDDIWIKPKDESEDYAYVNITFHALIKYWRDAIGDPPWPKL